MTVASSTISGNSAGFRGIGGGIWTGDNVTVTIDHSIVAGNTTGGSAPDVRPGTGPFTVRYSIIGDNTDAGLAEAPVGAPDENGNLIGDPGGMGVIDPLLGPLADNGGDTQTHALLTGSPAIDAGEPGFTPPPDFDQRGEPFVRVFGGRIDMGSYERQMGDMDFDGDVDFDDIGPLVLGLQNPDDYKALYATVPNANGDTDADGDLDFDDIPVFVAMLDDGAEPVLGSMELDRDVDFDDIDDFVGILTGGLQASSYAASSLAFIVFQDVSSQFEGIATRLVSTTRPAQPRLHLEWVQVGFTNDTVERHSTNDVPTFTFEGHESSQPAPFETGAAPVAIDKVFSSDLRRWMPQPSHNARRSADELQFARIWPTDQNWLLGLDGD